MLGRARDKAKASAPPPTVNKTDLAKQLLPASSPSAAQQQSQLTSWAAPNRSSSTFRHEPLVPRSNNHQPGAVRSLSTNSSKPTTMTRTNSVVSICASAGSFDELPASADQPFKNNSSVNAYLVNEDDFSDDNTLELDYECPQSLPMLPPQPQARKPVSPAVKQEAVPTTSQMSWSSSPQQHKFPPAKPMQLKRESPSQDPPPAKKRSLPGHWFQDKKTDVKHEASLETPAPKKKSELPWDATQSATKEQRKKLKSQKKKGESENDISMDEIHAITSGPAKLAKTSAIALSSEQQHVLDLVVKQKQSVFFTGPAGTGKSVLMRAIIAELKKKWIRDPERLSVTASTGLAACNISGQTLHSFAGIGLGKEDVPTLVKKIRRNNKAKTRWLRTNVLVIDEVSMVDGELFDKLSQIARTIRNNGRPFGGIQLVITGDFFQLPPVPDGGKKEAKFAFDAATWSTSIDHTIGLTQVFRQKDPHFANMLNEMRLGKISDDTVKTFKELSRPLNFDDGLAVTELFPTRQEVERANGTKLRDLPGEPYHYDSTDAGDPNIRDRLLSNMMAPKSMDLKKGAQVMLIKNMDDTLVNGSLGKVVSFMAEAVFENWAMQDQSLGSGDEADVDNSAKRRIKEFSRNPEGLKDLREYPVVRFTATDGTHRMLLCIPEEWKVELPTGEVQASRKQLPLILAWALSIHKAQGQTLERVKVDLGKVFEKGQAYVALSRAVSKPGLQVLRFEKGKVMAHPRVIQFYNKLYSAESAVKTKKKATSVSEFAYQAPPQPTKTKTTTTSQKTKIEMVDLDEEEAAMAAYG